MEDWARQYGWNSYPELSDYTSETAPPTAIGSQVTPTVSAQTYIVIDDASGEILAAQGADLEWPIASLTKLASVKTAFENGLDGGGAADIQTIDEVGGARLWVESGTTFLITDLVKATVVASANNAANALARATGLKKTEFVGRMNEFADSLNLSRTTFADPTGIELGNVSTAREMAAMARAVFKNENIRRLAGTAVINISALNEEYVRNISSTNWLLYDHAYDDVYVTAGKTGYLEEAGWNLVVRMHPMGEDETRSLLIVLLGSDSRRTSCDDAYRLAHWAWENFEWDEF